MSPTLKTSPSKAICESNLVVALGPKIILPPVFSASVRCPLTKSA